MSMTEARTKLGASDNLFKKVYQGLKARDVIEYIKNDLNIHKKIITVAERNVRLTQKYIKENLHDGPEDGPDFTLLYKEPIASQVFAYAQHMGDRGFTQRDISSEIMRGYGRLEPRNIVRNMLEKHKLIKKAGKREVGRQRHDLYHSKCPLVNNSLKFEQMPSFPYWQIRDDPGSANGSSGSSQMERREEVLFNFISEAQCVSGEV